MNIENVMVDLQEKISAIESDDRYLAKPALVQVNAPLALIQVDLSARLIAYKYTLSLLKKVK